MKPYSIVGSPVLHGSLALSRYLGLIGMRFSAQVPAEHPRPDGGREGGLCEGGAGHDQGVHGPGADHPGGLLGHRGGGGQVMRSLFSTLSLFPPPPF